MTVVAVRHRSALAEGFGHLRAAEWPWLVAAVGATCLTWVAAALARQGAVVQRLPVRRLLATQFAAGAANHLLPTGLGAGAVNLRFMTVCGVPLARSSAALALYLLAESVTRVGLLLVLLVAFPDALHLGGLVPASATGPLLLARDVLRGRRSQGGRHRARQPGRRGRRRSYGPDPAAAVQTGDRGGRGAARIVLGDVTTARTPRRQWPLPDVPVRGRHRHAAG